MRLTVFLALAFTIGLSTFCQAQGGRLDNQYFQLNINQPEWLPMSRVSLLDKSEFASTSSGRAINYLDGISHSKGLIPYVIFQQTDADLGTVNIKNYLLDIAESTSLPSFSYESELGMPLPRKHAEMHFNLTEEYALMTNEVDFENEPCVNISYMIPHGKGLMYMHCFSHVMDTETYYPKFEEIRKNLKFIFPTSSNLPSASSTPAADSATTNKETPSTDPKTNTETKVDKEGGSNIPKYLFMALAVMLLLFILGRVSKPKQ